MIDFGAVFMKAVWGIWVSLEGSCVESTSLSGQKVRRWQMHTRQTSRGLRRKVSPNANRG
jgi:hypothetical protein